MGETLELSTAWVSSTGGKNRSSHASLFRAFQISNKQTWLKVGSWWSWPVHLTTSFGFLLRKSRTCMHENRAPEYTRMFDWWFVMVCVDSDFLGIPNYIQTKTTHWLDLSGRKIRSSQKYKLSTECATASTIGLATHLFFHIWPILNPSIQWIVYINIPSF